MLTKKEREQVDSHKAIIEKPIPGEQRERYRVFMSLTLGELMALRDKLADNPTFVGADVSAYVNNAVERANVNL